MKSTRRGNQRATEIKENPVRKVLDKNSVTYHGGSLGIR
jgi:hypothetical protein